MFNSDMKVYKTKQYWIVKNAQNRCGLYAKKHTILN